VEAIEKKPVVLVTGSGGMLGSDIALAFQRSATVLAFNREQLDIARKSDVDRILFGKRPSLVINCAAFTKVDEAESKRNEAFNTNVKGVGILASSCRKIGAALAHFSTDYVFDGKKKGGYIETDRKRPLNYYGLTKSLGEDMIQQRMDNYFIVRTSWLFGKHGNNFVEAIRRQMGSSSIQVVNDQRGCPTYTKDLTAALPPLVEEYPYGIYHITNTGSCTWFDFAREVVQKSGGGPKVVPITSAELDRAAIRPKNSVLRSTKFKRKLPSWKSALQKYLHSR